MALTLEQETALLALLDVTNKTISDLEAAPTLAEDMLLPVEDSAGTYAASINDFKEYIEGKIGETASTATAAGTTTLTAASAPIQVFTGTTTQTAVLPNATTLKKDRFFTIINNSTGSVTVNLSGGTLAIVVVAGARATLRVTNISTSAGTWLIMLQSASDSVSGLVRLATNADVAAGSDALKAIVPSALLSLFAASARSTTSGSARLPVNISSAFSELIIKVKQDTTTIPAGGGATDITFDAAFPNACIGVVMTPRTWSGSNPAITQLYAVAFTASKFVASNPDGDTNCTGHNYIAIGY
jgi:hypothetical protein